MAMLLLNDVFSRTWGERAGPPPTHEYWTEVIGAVRRAHPDFLFAAEAYWDLEWQLQQLGFDYCYDKRLYDRLTREDAESVRKHLAADRDYQDGLIRFLENHDEPRAAAALRPSIVRSRLRSRKYSAMVPRKLNISRPVGVSVSTASVSERSLTPCACSL